jgi:hypothetical protein
VRRTTILALSLVWIGCSSLRAAPAGFVGITGSQFTYGGTVYHLKGTNYYPKDHMWQHMWNGWDWNEILSEADMIKNLGMNCARILVPYSAGGWNGPNIPQDRLIKLEDLVNLFGSKGIRSCITLFDWETTYPAANTQLEADHYTYLTTIVNYLKNNKYVFLWDVKNEPDHPNTLNGYDDWDYVPSIRATLTSWLQRMCNKVKQLDSNHPVTIGIRYYRNVNDVINYEDVATFHNYWPDIKTVQIPYLKTVTTKPIFLQEHGWPTYPPTNPSWNETEQLNWYIRNLDAISYHNITGGMQWMTFDEKSYVNPSESTQCFGIWRFDYSLKPAGAYYRDNYPVNAFPVEADTDPPVPVSNFTATGYDQCVRLTWTNPGNWDFTGAMIRYKTTGYPTGPTDGILLIDKAGAPGASETYDHRDLTNGVTYYYAIFAHDSVPNYSPAATTFATPLPCEPGQSIGEVRRLPDNTDVVLNYKRVTAIFATDSCIYVEEPNRTAGIRVANNGSGLALGDIVNISGKVTTRKPDGVNPSERVITNCTVVKIAPGVELEPLGVIAKNVGGAAAPPIPGVINGVGLDNVGSLVKLAGKVTNVSGNYIWVDDGSKVIDPSGRIGVMVKCASTPGVKPNDIVCVTGVIEGSIYSGTTKSRRYIHTRLSSDLRKLR